MAWGLTVVYSTYCKYTMCTVHDSDMHPFAPSWSPILDILGCGRKSRTSTWASSLLTSTPCAPVSRAAPGHLSVSGACHNEFGIVSNRSHSVLSYCRWSYCSGLNIQSQTPNTARVAHNANVPQMILASVI